MGRRGARSPINLMSLKEQVYHYLHEQIRRRQLKAGEAIDMDETAKKLGISKTPLRDALIELQVEGFVTMVARRGIYVRRLTLEDVRDIYQILGGLESAAILAAAPAIGPAQLEKMRRLDAEMEQALAADDFDAFYSRNLEFHDAYLGRCGNAPLLRLAANLKRRLYDFPRREKWIKEWEIASIGEHRQLLACLERGDFPAAAAFVRDVHWSFAVQERFIRRYYFDAE